MSSLGISPTSPSLLIPSNPSYAGSDSSHKGGILLNPRRESEPIPVSPSIRAEQPYISTSTPSPGNRRSSEPDSPKTPISPIDALPSSSPSGQYSSQFQSPPTSTAPLTSPSLQPPRIRFAPLPDPRRPRSLSTGRNINWKASQGEDGTTTRTIEIRGVSGPIQYDDEDDDGDVTTKSEGDDDYEGKRGGRRWSKTMTMGMGSMGMGVGSWKGTKKGTMKLLGMKEEKEVYDAGAPLKKSVSTGGFIGASPFRSTAETERKRSMQGPPVPTVSSRLETSHRRNSSLEPPTTSPLSSSPQPVRMLNGRVYGSRRASEAAQREKELREKNEPAFVEWGHGKSGGGLGSNVAPAASGRGFLGDAEEGSGMEWVKRRREERLKKAEEDKKAAEASRSGAIGFADPKGTNSMDLSPTSSVQDDQEDQYHQGDSGSISPGTSNSTSLVTPATATTPLPPTPIIHVSEHQSPSLNKALGSNPINKLGTSAPGTLEGQSLEHHTQAIEMPQRQDSRNLDVFDDEGDDDMNPSEEEVDDNDGEEEEDDGDFSSDDEGEEEAIRTTSSAAGVEVVSRHKN